MLCLLAARDFQRYRRAPSSLLESTRDAVDPFARNSIAWICLIGRSEASDFAEPMRRAEAALKAIPADQRERARNGLGPAQCRAGRLGEAIKTLEEGIKSCKGQSVPEDSALLAMGHHRLGHHDQARLWLARFKTWKRSEPGFRWHSSISSFSNGRPGLSSSSNEVSVCSGRSRVGNVSSYDACRVHIASWRRYLETARLPEQGRSCSTQNDVP